MMDAELRERFMSTIRKKNKPDGFTAKDVEVAAAGMAAAGKGTLHITFPDGAEVDVPIKDALMAYWGLENEQQKEGLDGR